MFALVTENALCSEVVLMHIMTQVSFSFCHHKVLAMKHYGAEIMYFVHLLLTHKLTMQVEALNFRGMYSEHYDLMKATR